MRAITAVVLLAIGAAIPTAAAAATRTDRVEATTTIAKPTAFSAQERRRPRVPIYRESYDRGVVPSYFPGANAVRDCSVSYVREFRPSGTVIAPHMHCVWRQP